MMVIIFISCVVLGVSVKIISSGLIGEQTINQWKPLSFLSSKKEMCECLFLQLIMIVLSVFLYGKYGWHLEFYKYLFFTVMMILIGLVDFKTTYVYRSTTLLTSIGALIFMFLEWIQFSVIPTDSVMGGLIGLVVIGLIVFLTRGMGEGDIEIAALAGLFLGIQGSIITLFFGFVLGGIAGVVLLSLKAKGLKDEMAFGPYLVMGAMIAMLAGNEIVNFYLNLYY